MRRSKFKRIILGITITLLIVIVPLVIIGENLLYQDISVERDYSPFLTHELNSINLPETDGISYYFSNTGNDSNSGLSPQDAFQTFQAIYSIELHAGDRILLSAGHIFNEVLDIDQSGTVDNPIIISTYLDPKMSSIQSKAIISGDYDMWGGIQIAGSYVIVANLEIRNWIAGISFYNSPNYVNLSYNYFTKNMIGVELSQGHGHFVGFNLFADNDQMQKWTLGADDDYGAQGVLVSADYNEIAYNAFFDQIAESKDYDTDGSAVEIYGGSHNRIHHNYATGDDIFTELGQSGSIPQTFNNSYYRNVILGEHGYPFFVQHAGSGYGPVYDTQFYENLFLFNKTGVSDYGPITDLVQVVVPPEEYTYFHVFNNTAITNIHPLGSWGLNEYESALYDADNGYFYGNHFHLVQTPSLSWGENAELDLLLNKTAMYPKNVVQIYSDSENLGNSGLDLSLLTPSIIFNEENFFSFF